MTKPKTTPKQLRPSICVGCGGAAACYNYGAPSCSSCKVFFRRTVMKEHVYLICLKDGMCAEDESIRPCRTCRFQRCVDGGMDAASVSTLKNPATNPVVQTFSKSIRKVSPSATKQLQEMGVLDRHNENSDNRNAVALRIQHSPSPIECKLDKMMEILLNLDQALLKLRCSTYSPVPTTELRIDDFAFSSSKMGGKLETMLAQSYEPMSIRLVPEELCIKHRLNVDFFDFDFSKRKLWPFQDQIYSIEFMKALPIYSMLEDCSKRVLLSSALTCTNFTTAFFSYSQNSERSCYPDGGVMTWSKEVQDESPHCTRFHTALIAAIRKVQLDKREYTLLKMISICNPMLNGLSDNDVSLLQVEKEGYTKTLLSYVLARHGVKEGPAHFAKLLSIIDLLNVLTSWLKSQHILILAMGLQKHRCPLGEDLLHSH